MTERRRVVIASNRVPPPPTEEHPWPAGGLVSALLPPLLEIGGLWFGWSGREGEPERPPHRTVTDSIDYATIDLSERELVDYYEGFCNRILWPRLHGLPEHAASLPREYWTYRTTNRRFAHALTPLLRPDDLVWVHDFQLMPLGRELRRLGWHGPLGYFHHVPVPNEQHWQEIPHADDLTALLGAYELVGVQTARDAERLRRLLAPEHRDRVTVHPVGIDPERFRAHARRASSNPLARTIDDRQVLFGVDRLDYTKGIRQRFEAFERLLQRDARWRGQVRFVQWAAPSRATVPEYRAERATIEEVAGRINRTFGAPHPVELDLTLHPPEEVAAGLSAADVCVVTSLADGMNLVAKEFAAVHSAAHPGVLVLSDTCGAAAQLGEALLVHATDIASIEMALERALAMPREERARRSAALRAVVDSATAQRWFQDFVTELEVRRKARHGDLVGTRFSGAERGLRPLRWWPPARAARRRGQRVD